MTARIVLITGAGPLDHFIGQVLTVNGVDVGIVESVQRGGGAGCQLVRVVDRMLTPHIEPMKELPWQQSRPYLKKKKGRA